MRKTFIFIVLFKMAFLELALGRSVFLRSSLSLSRSTALWARGDVKVDYREAGAFGGNGSQARRDYLQGSLDSTVSFDNGLDIYGALRYGHVHLYDGPFLGAAEDQSRSALSEISLGAGKVFYKDSDSLHGLFLKYIYPGSDSKRVKPAFLSFNDFGQHLELGYYSSFFFNSWELHPLIKYKHKTQGLGNNHAAIENKTFYNFSNRFKFGPGIDFLTTFGGRDVADQAFVEYQETTTWFPVWNKKEKWLGLSAIGAYRFDGEVIVDFYVHRKFWGENTDISTTIAVGIGKGIDF